jgi:hypothetical protein
VSARRKSKADQIEDKILDLLVDYLLAFDATAVIFLLYADIDGEFGVCPIEKPTAGGIDSEDADCIAELARSAVMAYQDPNPVAMTDEEEAAQYGIVTPVPNLKALVTSRGDRTWLSEDATEAIRELRNLTAWLVYLRRRPQRSRWLGTALEHLPTLAATHARLRDDGLLREDVQVALLNAYAALGGQAAMELRIRETAKKPDRPAAGPRRRRKLNISPLSAQVARPGARRLAHGRLGPATT